MFIISYLFPGTLLFLLKEGYRFIRAITINLLDDTIRLILCYIADLKNVFIYKSVFAK